jgi:macrolide-specific efflux system membrane fusion protein
MASESHGGEPAPSSDAAPRTRPSIRALVVGLSKPRGLGIFAICFLLAGGGLLAWWMLSPSDGSATTTLTAPVTRADVEDSVTATGTLQPKDYVDVGTQVSGQLKKLHVEIGAAVTAKQLLAEIDPSVYQSRVDADHAQILNQKAQIADRQAQLVLARLQYARQQRLARDSATTSDAVQSAQATQESAQAQLDSFKAQMQQTESTLHGDEANLGYTKIFAPMAGTVVSLTAKQGQTLNANQQAPIILRIADLSTMTVEAQVSEADIPKLRIGMDVYFTTLGGDNRRYYGKLRQIPPTPTVVNNVVLYDALFDVPNPDQILMSQMTAQIFFIVSFAKDAVLVPLPTLHFAQSVHRTFATGVDARGQFANGKQVYVTVIGADGVAIEREIKVGVMNRVTAQITSGLQPGEIVVVGSKGSGGVVRTPATSGPLTASPTRQGPRP